MDAVIVLDGVRDCHEEFFSILISTDFRNKVSGHFIMIGQHMLRSKTGASTEYSMVCKKTPHNTPAPPLSYPSSGEYVMAYAMAAIMKFLTGDESPAGVGP